MEHYGKRARFFIYNSANCTISRASRQMLAQRDDHQHSGVQRDRQDARRIYDELDDFQSRRPIDVIAANRPILILDEPQKMEGAKTMEALTKFRRS